MGGSEKAISYNRTIYLVSAGYFRPPHYWGQGGQREMSMSTTQSNPKHTNRLAREKSPYLLQHAHNPVQWFPWGPEAWEKARAENKPVFLSVGYSACHWCHVMERESFEVEAVAALLNENFVSIKVDREERPDVDEIYMTAVQMLTGQGGWPMSVFLTPQGLPFYGGTYFPPEGRGGRIGFSSLLVQLAEAWKTRRTEVDEVAQNIVDDLTKAVKQKPLPATGATLNAFALIENAVNDMTARFDAANGGFGSAPKFPPHHALRLLTHAARTGNDDAPLLLLTTLDKMALGGIYDHIGGGFHRYATDAVWLLPHFEKMLYDNALLARVYADAFDLTGRAAYARIARETCDFVLRDLTEAENGGFHAALDADSEGEEGKFYVWTPQEVADVLGDEPTARAFCAVYHIAPNGNFRDEATGQASGTNIPYLSVGESDAVLPDTLEPAIQDARDALLAQRNQRVWPGKDDKIITAWNGLMIGALAFCGATLSEPRYIEAARRAADFCLTTLQTPNGHLMRRWARGEAGLPAFLDDYAYLADGLLDLWDATGEEKWRDAAFHLADVLLASFWDETDSGFFFTEHGGESLIAPAKDMFDGATPSPNGVAVRVLVRLGKRTGGEKYADCARRTLHAFGGLLERALQGTPTLLLAAADLFAEAEESVTRTPPLPPSPTVALVSSAGVDGLRVAPGQETHVAFVLRIAPGFHVNAQTVNRAELIPTKATFTSGLPAAVGPVAYPPAKTWDDGTGGAALSVYEGEVDFNVPVAVSSDAAPGRYTLTLTISCQPCSQSECLLPATVSASVPVEVRDMD